jgi:hypothetical protein
MSKRMKVGEIRLNSAVVRELLIAVGKRERGLNGARDFGIAKLDFQLPASVTNDAAEEPVRTSFTVHFDYWRPLLEAVALPRTVQTAAARAAMRETMREYGTPTTASHAFASHGYVTGIGTMPADPAILASVFRMVKRLGTCYDLLSSYAEALVICQRLGMNGGKSIEAAVHRVANKPRRKSFEDRVRDATKRLLGHAVSRALEETHRDLKQASKKLEVTVGYLRQTADELAARNR